MPSRHRFFVFHDECSLPDLRAYVYAHGGDVTAESYAVHACASLIVAAETMRGDRGAAALPFWRRQARILAELNHALDVAGKLPGELPGRVARLAEALALAAAELGWETADLRD